MHCTRATYCEENDLFDNDYVDGTREDGPGKTPNIQVEGGYKGKYKWDTKQFKIPGRKSKGAWILSESEQNRQHELMGSCKVTKCPEANVGLFMAEGNIYMSRRLQKSGNYTFSCSVSMPQSMQNVHLLIGFKQAVGCGEILVKGGKTMSSRLAYRCSNATELLEKVVPQQKRMPVRTKKYHELLYFEKRLQVYVKRRRAKVKVTSRFVPLPKPAQEEQVSLVQKYKVIGPYIPEGYTNSSSFRNLATMSTNLLCSFCRGDYNWTILWRQNTYFVNFSFFQEKLNGFFILYLQYVINKKAGLQPNTGNFTPTGVFRDTSRAEVKKVLANLYEKGVNLRYTDVRSCTKLIEFFSANSTERHLEYQQQHQLAQLEIQRRHCAQINDYSLVGSLSKQYKPFFVKKFYRGSRAIMLQAIRKEAGLVLPADLTNLIPSPESQVHRKPLNTYRDGEMVFSKWKAEQLLLIENALKLNNEKKSKLSKKAVSQLKKNLTFLQNFSFVK